MRLFGRRPTSGVETVPIGSQVWTARNLQAEDPAEAPDPAWDAAKLGRLLSHEEAVRLAPPGFHLPTADEWQQLNAQISRSVDSRKLLLRDFRLVLHDHHGSFWTATITSSGTYAVVADTSTYSWDEGNYGFVLQTKNRDLFRYPARYVKG